MALLNEPYDCQFTRVCVCKGCNNFCIKSFPHSLPRFLPGLIGIYHHQAPTATVFGSIFRIMRPRVHAKKGQMWPPCYLLAVTATKKGPQVSEGDVMAGKKGSAGKSYATALDLEHDTMLVRCAAFMFTFWATQPGAWITNGGSNPAVLVCPPPPSPPPLPVRVLWHLWLTAVDFSCSPLNGAVNYEIILCETLSPSKTRRLGGNVHPGAPRAFRVRMRQGWTVMKMTHCRLG